MNNIFNQRRGALWNIALLGLFSGISSAHAAVPSGYYDSADPTTAQTLHSSLHEIIDDHQRFPYTSTSTDTWDILEAADQDPDNANNVIDIYQNASYAKAGGGNTFYNREHSWPKSYGFPKDGSDNYPYTDVHHLFIADSGYNSSRNNKPFADCPGCAEKTTLTTNERGGAGQSNWTSGSSSDGSWQTWSGRKGDSARALMYLAVRYDGGSHGVTGVSEPDLILTDDRSLIGSSNTGANLSVAYMGLKSVLLQWHKEDPVDAFEQRHNDTAYAYQGNRNPFVDHPEWIACVFEGICGAGGGDTTPPTAPTGLVTTGGSSVSLSWTANSETDLAGYHIYRSTTSGTSGARINSSLITSTTFSDTTVAASTTYYYTVKAVDSAFNESTASNEASATTDGSAPPVTASAWINEIHYDNDGTDSNEGFEIAGGAGTNLTGWTVVGYNGSNGAMYNTINLSGTITDQQNGFGTVNFSFSAMQNGAPDGLALVDNSGQVIQLLSYEGTLTAVDGPAAGQTAIDIGVSETTTTPVGHSLQLTGNGSQYSDFTWAVAAANTFGTTNTGQAFNGGSTPVNLAPSAAFSQQCTHLSCAFDGTASADSDGTISHYSWDFGDGNSASGATPSHSYAFAGDYNVILTVTDNGNATDAIAATVTATAVPSTPWVNEFHYDNSGSDTNEGIEIAGSAGTDLSGWSIVAYNGSNNSVYASISLTGTLTNQQNGYGSKFFAFAGLQNGAPDGFALVDNSGAVVQFLSYEGTLTANSGPAAGMTSQDVGVAENGSTLSSHSLQLIGSGNRYEDFTWAAAQSHTRNGVNTGQTFN